MSVIIHKPKQGKKGKLSMPPSKLAPKITNLPADIVFDETNNDCGEHISWSVPHISDKEIKL